MGKSRIAASFATTAIACVLVAGCSNDDSKSSTTVTVTAGQSSKAPAVIPPLKPVTDAYIRDRAAAGGNVEAIIKMLPKYADPGCTALLTSIIRTFHDGGDQEAVSFTSVTQDGATGVSVDDGGDSLHWNYANGKWLFTCDASMFEMTTDETTEPEAVATEAAPEPSDTCDTSQIGTRQNGLRCTYMGGGSPRWVQAAPGATEGN